MHEVPPQAKSALEIVGPFERFEVVWDGYHVPYLSARRLDNGLYDVMVDDRFAIHRAASWEDLENWIPMIAHAMAVAAGYSCHGDNCRPINPFTRRMRGLSSQPSLHVVQSPEQEG